ncbi:CPBP family intramembrane glutamic endopeptidase [Staphylococcus sp. 17KM0847]|uniref:CPBP family intramembrane glutamic endopeptidase n=1 Tax=Staphylococcus sp. 17KM0847 TaxID=2583989 RepID=UPI0021557DE8|nr:CPBP family intramembrane glutamic endopeptidase [Staphylococcus sp. 17KM0847]
MNHSRISGFQWAMSIFLFFVLSYVAPLILQDFQKASGLKNFVFTLNSLGPFLAAIICLIIFKNKREQLSGFKLTINFKVIERLLLALFIPLVIFISSMYMFNTYADSFILLQANDLSETIWTILIGHLLMAFCIEFGFRSYLFNIVEKKLPHFFTNIVVSFLYLIWDVNTAFGMPYTMYSAIYVFAFSMIAGELIRGTGGRSIYIVTIFHAAMTFAKVFFFSEELGDVFSMKVLAYSTAGIAIIVVTIGVLSSIIHFIRRKIAASKIQKTEATHAETSTTTDKNEEKTTSSEDLSSEQPITSSNNESHDKSTHHNP